jgi:hypothetical protein
MHQQSELPYGSKHQDFVERLSTIWVSDREPQRLVWMCPHGFRPLALLHRMWRIAILSSLLSMLPLSERKFSGQSLWNRIDSRHAAVHYHHSPPGD